MSEPNRAGHARRTQARSCLRATASLAAALLVLVALLFGGAMQNHSAAYADANATPSATTSSETRSDERASSVSADSGEPAESPSTNEKTAEQKGVQGIEIAILAGIILVASLFVGWIVRLNVNMKKMNDSMRSK